jgi:hypothetical protein
MITLDPNLVALCRSVLHQSPARRDRLPALAPMRRVAARLRLRCAEVCHRRCFVARAHGISEIELIMAVGTQTARSMCRTV